jgi:hypothetical protein
VAHRSQSARAWRIAAIAAPALTAVVTATAISPAAVAATHQPAGRPSAATGWRVIRTFASPNAVLDDVTGFADGTAWASGSTAASTPVVYHLAGGTWTPTALPGSSGVFAPSLSATSKTNVWASLANEPMVARLSGKSWVTHSFSSGSDQIGIDGVVTTGPKNTWAFTFDFNTGQESAEHYTGSTWMPTALPVEVDGGGLTGLVSASGPGNIWTWAFNPKNSKTTTLHYDGHQWTVVGIPANLVPSTQHVLGKQILAESPTDVWATANNNEATGSIILLHNKGRGWARVTGKLPKGQLAGPITSDGHGGLWLEAYSPSFTYFLLHYAGGKWTRFNLPSDKFGPIDLHSLRLIPGTRSVLGAGVVSTNPDSTNGSVVVKYGS